MRSRLKTKNSLFYCLMQQLRIIQGYRLVVFLLRCFRSFSVTQTQNPHTLKHMLYFFSQKNKDTRHAWIMIQWVMR